MAKPTPTSLFLLVMSMLAPAGLAAQSPGTGAGGTVSRFIPRTTLLRMYERPAELAGGFVVLAPIDSVWKALRATLDKLGVPIAFDEPKVGEIGHPQAKIMRRMGKERLSSYLRCGSGLTGPNADSYTVYLSFVTFVQQQGENEVVLQPFLTAQALNPSGARGDVVDCATTGRLESRIQKEVTTRLIRSK